MFATGMMLVLAAATLAPQETLSDEQLAAIAGDPPFVEQKLRLVDVPSATGPAVQ